MQRRRLALASLGVGIYFVATAPSNKTSAALTLSPSVGATHQMLVLGGRF